MLFITVGLPGSGKSTYARANFRHIVSPDRIRAREFGVEFEPEVERAVWRRARSRTRDLLEAGCVVCFDATSVSRHRRRSLIVLAREAGAPAAAIWLDVPAEVAWARNAERERKVPRAAFVGMARAFEPPTLEEGFVAIRVVDGNGRWIMVEGAEDAPIVRTAEEG